MYLRHDSAVKLQNGKNPERTAQNYERHGHYTSLKVDSNWLNLRKIWWNTRQIKKVCDWIRLCTL